MHINEWQTLIAATLNKWRRNLNTYLKEFKSNIKGRVFGLYRCKKRYCSTKINHKYGINFLIHTNAY